MIFEDTSSRVSSERYLRAVAAGRNTPPGPLTRAIAAILYNAFLELLITQKQFGQRVGLAQSSVSYYLSGVKVLDMEIFVRLCTALDLEPSEVLVAAVKMIA